MIEIINKLAYRLSLLWESYRYSAYYDTILTAVLAALLVFGALNALLGFRLLRFWVMLGGFGVGAVGGVLITYIFLPESSNFMLFAAGIGAGIVLAIIAFLIYKAGIFLLGAGLGFGISLYLIRPTGSAMFFVCILIGVVLGILALKYCKMVIIVTTSLAGGGLIGYSAAELAHLSIFPYAFLIGAAAAALGTLFQFGINKDDEEDEEEEGEDIKKRSKKISTSDTLDYSPEDEDDYDDFEDEESDEEFDEESGEEDYDDVDYKLSPSEIEEILKIHNEDLESENKVSDDTMIYQPVKRRK